MTSKIAGIYKCLKIGALISCLTICSSASGHYYATQTATIEESIVTNETETQAVTVKQIDLAGMEQVAGMSFDVSEYEGIDLTKIAPQIVATSEAAIELMTEAQTEEAVQETEKETEKETVKETEKETEEETVKETEKETEKETVKAAPVVEKPAVSEKFANLAIATIKEDWLNIRTGASSDAEIIGKLYPGGAGTIVEEKGDWTKISSGNVTGWVSNSFIAKRIDAQNLAGKFGKQYAVISADGLRIRSQASTDSRTIGSASKGEKYPVISVQDGWIAISFDGTSGFISADYAKTDVSFGKAISIEEEKAAIAEQKRIEAEKKAEEARRAEEARKAEEAKKTTEATTAKQTTAAPKTTEAPKSTAAPTTAAPTTAAGGLVARGRIKLSESDVTLMAAVVQNEAGGSTYENKLAVANVILNRVESGKWGSSVSSVIYAKGQFSGASTGRIDSLIAAGPKSSCVQAVKDAAAGKNNIGNIMFFCATWVMDESKYESYTIIGDNCFYVRKK